MADGIKASWSARKLDVVVGSNQGIEVTAPPLAQQTKRTTVVE